MYSVILAAVNGDGSVGITGSGQTLRCIGNKTVYAGQTVDTDGRYIYGSMSTRGSSFVPVAQMVVPWLYYEKMMYIPAQYNSRGEQTMFAGTDILRSALYTVAGKNNFLVNDNGRLYDLYTGREYSKNTGTPSDCCVSPDGDYYSINAGAADSAEKYDLVLDHGIYRRTTCSTDVVTYSNLEYSQDGSSESHEVTMYKNIGEVGSVDLADLLSEVEFMVKSIAESACNNCEAEVFPTDRGYPPKPQLMGSSVGVQSCRIEEDGSYEIVATADAQALCWPWVNYERCIVDFSGGKIMSVSSKTSSTWVKGYAGASITVRITNGGRETISSSASADYFDNCTVGPFVYGENIEVTDSKPVPQIVQELDHGIVIRCAADDICYGDIDFSQAKVYLDAGQYIVCDYLVTDRPHNSGQFSEGDKYPEVRKLWDAKQRDRKPLKENISSSSSITRMMNGKFSEVYSFDGGISISCGDECIYHGTGITASVGNNLWGVELKNGYLIGGHYTPVYYIDKEEHKLVMLNAGMQECYSFRCYPTNKQAIIKGEMMRDER